MWPHCCGFGDLLRCLQVKFARFTIRTAAVYPVNIDIDALSANYDMEERITCVI